MAGEKIGLTSAIGLLDGPPRSKSRGGIATPQSRNSAICDFSKSDDIHCEHFLGINLIRKKLIYVFRPEFLILKFCALTW